MTDMISISILQEILDILNRISTALDLLDGKLSKLSSLSGGLTAPEAQQIRDAVANLAQKIESISHS